MAQFGTQPGERGYLEIQTSADGSLGVFFVPRELPTAGSDAEKRLAAGVKLVEIDLAADELRLYPTDTRPWADDYLGPKYAKIRTIILHDLVGGMAHQDPDSVFTDLESDFIAPELRDLLGVLPPGLTKDGEFGLGFARECDPILDLIESQTDCEAIDLSSSGKPTIDGGVFRISYGRFEELRSELARIKSRGDRAILRVKRAYAHNELASVLGIEPTQYSLGRHPTTRWMTYEAAAEKPLSSEEQEALLAAATLNAAQIAANSPAKLVRLQREIEVVNLDQLIDAYGRALDARHTEGWWQEFLELNVFALELLFGGPTVLVGSQVSIGDAGGSIKGRKIADYLFENSMTNNAALVEIKKPTTQLMNRTPYRDGVHGVYSEITKSVIQVLDQARRLMSHEEGTRSRTTNDSWVGTAPRCFVLAGRAGSLDTPEKRRSFELYREHLSGVRIVTYDELHEQLKVLRGFLAVDTEV